MAEHNSKARVLRRGSLACASVVVTTAIGDEDIGTAFHVGEGVYLTARHVLEGNRVLAISPCTDGYARDGELATTPTQAPSRTFPGETEEENRRHLSHGEISLLGSPCFHRNAAVDVAAFRVEGLDPNTPHFSMGTNWDDLIANQDWLLTEATVFGYPAIPFSVRPELVVDRVTVNAVIDTRLDRYVRFVVSGIPRGGFSGGPAYHDYGFLFGMITEALEEHRADRVVSYLTVLGVDALWECLEDHGILPACQSHGIAGADLEETTPDPLAL